MTTATIERQLELPLTNESGVVVKDSCLLAQANLKYFSLDIKLQQEIKANIIPGLDSSLCRCKNCSRRALDGIYWIDQRLRIRVLKRHTAFAALNSGADRHEV